MLAWFTRWRTRPAPPSDAAQEEPNGNQLIEDFSALVICRCPCGSAMLHHLTLTGTSDCRRCGRTIGIRSIEYFRRGPTVLPDPRITVGYVLTEQALRRRQTSGVH